MTKICTKLVLPDIEMFDVRTEVDYRDMTRAVYAELESKITRALVAQAHAELARSVDMTPAMFTDFLHFLTTDPEIKARFTAYRTAKRLMR